MLAIATVNPSHLQPLTPTHPGPTSHKPGSVYALLEETHDGGVTWDPRLCTSRAALDPLLPMGVFQVSATSATGERGSVGYRLQPHCSACRKKHTPFTKATDDPKVAAEVLRHFTWPPHNDGQCGLKVVGVFLVQAGSEGAAASGDSADSSAVLPHRARSAPARKQAVTPFSERELASLWLLVCNHGGSVIFAGLLILGLARAHSLAPLHCLIQQIPQAVS
jgi:hypothetical protein